MADGDEGHSILSQDGFDCIFLNHAANFLSVMHRKGDGVSEWVKHTSLISSYSESKGPFDASGSDLDRSKGLFGFTPCQTYDPSGLIYPGWWVSIHVYSFRPNEADWSTAIFEAGLSESLRLLRLDAKLWLTESGDNMKTGIVISAKPATLHIESGKSFQQSLECGKIPERALPSTPPHLHHRF